MLTYHDHDLLHEAKQLTPTQLLTLMTIPASAPEKTIIEKIEPADFNELEYAPDEESFGSLNPCGTRTYIDEEPDEFYD